MFYRGRSGSYVKVDEFIAVGEDQVMVQSGDLEFFTSETNFKSSVVKSLPRNEERQAALDDFLQSLPE
jgi:hypothetical protein